MASEAKQELRARTNFATAEKLVELHPDQDFKAVVAWDALYVSSKSFDIATRIDYKPENPDDSLTWLDSGTFSEVHRDNDSPETHVVMVARFHFDGTTGVDSDLGTYYEHYANTLDAAVKIRAASWPDREPKWAAVPHAFTLHVDDETGQVRFIFFMRRCVPLEKSIAYRARKINPAAFHRLMWSLVVSAWFVENMAKLAHRDIKPANVLVTSQGRAVLSDFGSSRPVGCAGNPAWYMNPPWMNPEELGAIRSANKYTWELESSAFAIGLVLLSSCWSSKKFNTFFPQADPQSSWVVRVHVHRSQTNGDGYYSAHRVMLNKISEKPRRALETAAMMLANPKMESRSKLSVIEKLIRPSAETDPAAFLELPAALQCSGDVSI